MEVTFHRFLRAVKDFGYVGRRVVPARRSREGCRGGWGHVPTVVFRSGTWTLAWARPAAQLPRGAESTRAVAGVRDSRQRVH